MWSRRIRQQQSLLLLFPDSSSSLSTATASARTITTFPSIWFPLYCQHPPPRCPPLLLPRFSSHYKYPQGQQRQQIRRSYWFVPVSWEEFQERAERWWETKPSRIIQVRLLNEEAAAQQKKQKKKGRVRERFHESLQKRQESYRGWKVRRQQQYQVLMARYNTIIGRQHKIRDYREQWKARRRRRRDQNPPGYLRRWKQHLNFHKKNILVEEYSEPAWFEARTGRPLTSKDPTGQRFVNPWQSQSTNGIQSVTTILQWQWQRFQRTLRTHYVQPTLVFLFGRITPNTNKNDNVNNDISPLISHRIPPFPSLSQSKNKNKKINHNLWMTWIGHSTCVFQIHTTTNYHHHTHNPAHIETNNTNEERGSHHTMDDDDAVQSYTILTDPMFSTRASPYTHYMGVPREVPPAHTIPELLAHLHTQQHQTHNSTRVPRTTTFPESEETVKETAAGVIDVCCITHDHYDHMDTASIQQLQAHVRWWVVPLGLAEWLVERCGIRRAQIVELEWWEKVCIQKTKKQQQSNNNKKKKKGNGNDRDDAFTVRTYTNSHRHSRVDTNIPSADNNEKDDDDGSDTHRADSNWDGNNNDQALTITCCPASHWSGRTVMDRNKRLWCSFAISVSSTAATTVAATPTTTKVASPASSSILDRERERERETQSQPTNKNEFEDEDDHNNNNKKIFNIFFCGDTSYPNNFPLFQQIGDAMGPFDLACIPIGAYLPKEMNENAHCDPYEALKIHNDIRSRQSIGIHWGSFKLGEERFGDPPKLLADAVLKQQQQQQQQLDANHDKDDTSDDKKDEQKSLFHPIKFHVIGHGGTVALEKKNIFKQGKAYC